VTGHLTFSSGQEVGYWLLDWSVALMVCEEYAQDPYVGLRLLREDLRVWEREVRFQTRHFKEAGVISMVTSASPLDELPGPLRQSVLSRRTISDLHADPAALENEIQLLEAAESDIPPGDGQGMIDDDLRAMVVVTHRRVTHALLVRRALRADQDEDVRAKEQLLDEARALRERTLTLVQRVAAASKVSFVFEKEWENPTSYSFGYVWPAVALHFWEREEQIVRLRSYDNPLFMNIYNPVRIAL
jgi:hypothetical protein